jgi:hypothetical protein
VELLHRTEWMTANGTQCNYGGETNGTQKRILESERERFHSRNTEFMTVLFLLVSQDAYLTDCYAAYFSRRSVIRHLSSVGRHPPGMTNTACVQCNAPSRPKSYPSDRP